MWPESYRRAIARVCPVLAAVALLLAFLQPTPGLHSWFHELSGDWSIRIQGTEYDIGPKPDKAGTFSIFRWIPVPASNGKDREMFHVDVSDVVRYASNEAWILAEKRRDWVWINSTTNELETVHKKDDLAAQAPVAVVQLLETLHKPKGSSRNLLILLSASLAAIGLLVAGVNRFETWKKGSP